jgi:hypothetical protein
MGSIQKKEREIRKGIKKDYQRGTQEKLGKKSRKDWGKPRKY